ncbi:MAG: transposon-encoded TnpW family protein [Firmicutes bacterium]|nr:transposon-encoded TnpW family protein [Bacillota bacterium]
MSTQTFCAKPQAGTQRTIGTTTYLVTRSFQPDAKEDAQAKMARVIRNEAMKVLKNQGKIAA